MVYGIQTEGRRGVEYCAILLHSYCNRVSNAGGGAQYKDKCFVHNSLDVKEYLVKANPSVPARLRLLRSARLGLHKIFVHFNAFVNEPITIVLLLPPERFTLLQ